MYSILRFFPGALVTVSYPSFYFYFAERFSPDSRSKAMTICDLIGALTEMMLRRAFRHVLFTHNNDFVFKLERLMAPVETLHFVINHDLQLNHLTSNNFQIRTYLEP